MGNGEGAVDSAERLLASRLFRGNAQTFNFRTRKGVEVGGTFSVNPWTNKGGEVGEKRGRSMKSLFINRTYLLPFLVLIFIAFAISLLLPRYRVEDSNESQVSWYGGRFHGRTAASGRIYNMLDFTAAHFSHPMGSRLRITNLSNEKSVVVEVTDRGPYKMNRKGRVVRPLQPHPRREVDLSYRAARKLDLLRTGIADARIEYLAE